ncbi:MAG: hypothetical protein NT013_19335, partial [Planctomycetia bacterium]|nr:hypothetical protein [Planctomycetia bacterium]
MPPGLFVDAIVATGQFVNLGGTTLTNGTGVRIAINSEKHARPVGQGRAIQAYKLNSKQLPASATTK